MEPPDAPAASCSSEPGARLHGAILRWGRRRGWDPDLAEDVAQSTVEEFWRLNHNPNLPPTPVTFRRARGYARKILAERLPSLGEQVHVLAAVDPCAKSILLQDLHSCLDRLTSRESEALRGLYLEGRSRPELAAAMGLTPEGLRVLCHRATRRLRSLLSKSAKRSTEDFL